MLTRYTKKFVRYLRSARAVSALEYALLIGIIAIAIAAALNTLGDSVKEAIDTADDKVQDAIDEIGSDD